ncbi:MAG TPA: alpha/beta hydrolase [Gemmatimonadaceae bacterium]|nr:alpha/beta hydrolase [Gemmatimonadaceae bacterium]
MRTLTLPEGLTATVEEPAQPAARPPVLFVHGMFGGAWYFEKFQRCFAAHGYPSYAINLRGHHDSRPVHDIGTVSVRDYVDDTRLALGAIRRAPDGALPIVIGHSMGGLIAQKVAEAGAVSAAVLLCAAPPRGISVLSRSLLALAPRFGPAIVRSRALYPRPEDAARLVFNRTPAAEQRALFDRFAPESGRAAREMAFSLIPVDAAKVRCPVLSVAAADDRMVLPRVGRRIARKYHARHEEFPERGHFLVWEPGWEAVAEQVACWLEA